MTDGYREVQTPDARRLEVRTMPGGAEYRVFRSLGAGDEVELPELGRAIAVASLLPPR